MARAKDTKIERRVYLLDEQQEPITELNTKGEIFVFVPQVSLGYLNRPSETEERFIHVGSALRGQEGSPVRLYRTGDLGEWRDRSGSLDYVGQADQQIKRSGNRVELGDIERTLEAHPQVHSCVVKQHLRSTSDLLIAYIIPSSSMRKNERQQIISWTKERLPPYMVPDQIKELEKFPLSTNGQVDRSLFHPETRERPSSDVHGNGTAKIGEQWLQSKLQESFDLIGHIMHHGIYGCIPAKLPFAMPTIRKVACFARGQGNLSAGCRIQKALEQFDLWDGSLGKIQKITVLEGGLGNNTLGLGEDQFQWLANWASVIFHLGARVNWCELYEGHFGANVVGTRNIIRLAGQGRRKVLHYVSVETWNVTGYMHKTKRVFEDEPLQPYLDSLPYGIGYAQSQWVANEMLHRARARRLPAAIYRPGFVIGDHQRALKNPDDFFARFIVGCTQSECFFYLPDQ
ncbi:hypothetical protein NUU61_003441 [Penicillium alfredii]|uniref:Thioester reductase (TE) domain-containing protein n=1 Tax=Penicillium alfredii TaxID=1506179 RepID=A0A9W9KGX1_9EURO|nr:uncharacterized protein NUU61_003441 [Penicillium alfredii]KAJ5106094.1 hypothetical protein NUU61_003441 [Penicillium alfredii]